MNRGEYNVRMSALRERLDYAKREMSALNDVKDKAYDLMGKINTMKENAKQVYYESLLDACKLKKQSKSILHEMRQLKEEFNADEVPEVKA